MVGNRRELPSVPEKNNEEDLNNLVDLSSYRKERAAKNSSGEFKRKNEARQSGISIEEESDEAPKKTGYKRKASQKPTRYRSAKTIERKKELGRYRSEKSVKEIIREEHATESEQLKNRYRSKLNTEEGREFYKNRYRSKLTPEEKNEQEAIASEVLDQLLNEAQPEQEPTREIPEASKENLEVIFAGMQAATAKKKQKKQLAEIIQNTKDLFGFWEEGEKSQKIEDIAPAAKKDMELFFDIMREATKGNQGEQAWAQEIIDDTKSMFGHWDGEESFNTRMFRWVDRILVQEGYDLENARSMGYEESRGFYKREKELINEYYDKYWTDEQQKDTGELIISDIELGYEPKQTKPVEFVATNREEMEEMYQKWRDNAGDDPKDKEHVEDLIQSSKEMNGFLDDDDDAFEMLEPEIEVVEKVDKKEKTGTLLQKIAEYTNLKRFMLWTTAFVGLSWLTITAKFNTDAPVNTGKIEQKYDGGKRPMPTSMTIKGKGSEQGSSKDVIGDGKGKDGGDKMEVSDDATKAYADTVETIQNVGKELAKKYETITNDLSKQVDKASDAIGDNVKFAQKMMQNVDNDLNNKILKTYDKIDSGARNIVKEVIDMTSGVEAARMYLDNFNDALERFGDQQRIDELQRKAQKLKKENKKLKNQNKELVREQQKMAEAGYEQGKQFSRSTKEKNSEISKLSKEKSELAKKVNEQKKLIDGMGTQIAVTEARIASLMSGQDNTGISDRGPTAEQKKQLEALQKKLKQMKKERDKAQKDYDTLRRQMFGNKFMGLR